jgi:hypothetical protein
MVVQYNPCRNRRMCERATVVEIHSAEADGVKWRSARFLWSELLVVGGGFN